MKAVRPSAGDTLPGDCPQRAPASSTPDWVELRDPQSRRRYYWNKATRESVWEKPEADFTPLPASPPSAKKKDIDAKFKDLKADLGVHMGNGQHLSALGPQVLPTVVAALQAEHTRAEQAVAELQKYKEADAFFQKERGVQPLASIAAAFATADSVARARVHRSCVDEILDFAHNINLGDA